MKHELQGWSNLYRQFTFCRTVGRLQDSPHHIRELKRGERAKLKYGIRNELATKSLCGFLPAGHALDLIIGVNLDFNDVCVECAWLYWNILLERAEGLRDG